MDLANARVPALGYAFAYGKITKKEAGISRNKYRRYFENSNVACAYVLD